MTRLLHIGGEAGHEHAEGLTISGTTFTLDTSIKRSGTRSFKFDASAACFATYSWGGATEIAYIATAWFYLPAASGYPSSACRIFSTASSGSSPQFAVVLDTDGTAYVSTGASTTKVGGDTTAALATDTWHRVDILSQNGTPDLLDVRVNGVTLYDTAGMSTTPDRIRFGWVDDPGTSEVIYFDDVIINNDEGTDNTTFPGDEHVVLLLPTADSANDGFQGGGGGTSNMFEAVNNIPPVGVDNGSATDTSQIECANSDTTDNYDATMTTYTAAGIDSYDTITAIYAVAEGGNSSTTGSNTLGLSCLSNPAITEVVQSIDVNDNTYPTGWNRLSTAISEMPSVTVGTAPVVQVRKGVATTRVAACCLMGLYVSYFDGSPPAASDRGPQIIWIM